jgi:hemoglobin-like flavoprotein
MDKQILSTFTESLRRCTAGSDFEERFYEIFLASSPKVAERFSKTDFRKQKRALRASFHAMLSAAYDGESGPEKHLGELAERHSSRELNIGAELYDYWLDSLLATVKEFDGEYTPEVEDAWEQVMDVGIRYLLSRY